jgi:hypothetical protein
LEAGAVQLTVAWASAAVAVTPVGEPGDTAGALGVTAALAKDAALVVPALLVAVTVKV